MAVCISSIILMLLLLLYINTPIFLFLYVHNNCCSKNVFLFIFFSCLLCYHTVKIIVGNGIRCIGVYFRKGIIMIIITIFRLLREAPYEWGLVEPSVRRAPSIFLDGR